MTVEASPLGSAGGVRPPDGPSASALVPGPVLVLVLVLVLRWAEAPTSVPVPVPVPELGQSPASLPSPSSSPLLFSSRPRSATLSLVSALQQAAAGRLSRSYCYIATSGAGGVETSRAPATSLSLHSRALLGGRSEKLRPPEHTTSTTSSNSAATSPAPLLLLVRGRVLHFRRRRSLEPSPACEPRPISHAQHRNRARRGHQVSPNPVPCFTALPCQPGGPASFVPAPPRRKLIPTHCTGAYMRRCSLARSLIFSPPPVSPHPRHHPISSRHLVFPPS